MNSGKGWNDFKVPVTEKEEPIKDKDKSEPEPQPSINIIKPISTPLQTVKEVSKKVINISVTESSVMSKFSDVDSDLSGVGLPTE